VSLVPPDAPAPDEALAAIAAADQIVVGPGSLYTSVLAVVAVPSIREALAAAPGRVVYVCNLRSQPPETDGLDVGGHVRALLDHGLRVDVVLRDPAGLALGDVPVPVADAALARADGLGHDPVQLATALADLVG
jgi:uncharacterized cofD-like protein